MPLEVPNLDDRTFADLVKECQAYIKDHCPAWTDRSPSDPGIVLLELFAHLTELMIFRLNRLPEKAFIEFLRLLDVRLYPPTAAVVQLVFSRPQPLAQELVIPAGTRVTTERRNAAGESPIFTTDESATIPANAVSVAVSAHHCDWIGGELLGVSTGQAGQRWSVRRPPIVGGTVLEIGVELPDPLPAARAAGRNFGGKFFQTWQRADDFVDQDPDGPVYLADLQAGTVTFAPALQRVEKDVLQEKKALAAIPPAGREIRAWYRTGGGPGGNVAAGSLTVLKDPLPGAVTVTNPENASGGTAAESLDNALRRGPQEIHSLHRAVTARDYVLLAQRAGGVARAKAFTKAEEWTYAAPGTVAVVLVPAAEETAGAVSTEFLEARQSPDVLRNVQTELDRARPLGTVCEVSWVKYKQVHVSARVVVHPGEDPDKVRERLHARLHGTLSPLPSEKNRADGWPFGRPLRVSDVYDLLLREPSVSYLRDVELVAEDAPDRNVAALCADPLKAKTWYAASDGDFFRTTNDAEGWEKLDGFPGETIKVIRAHPDRAGYLAMILNPDAQRSRVLISRDSGSTWTAGPSPAYLLGNAAWLERDGQPFLLLAADNGLYEVSLDAPTVPKQIQVDPAQSDLGFTAVAVARTSGGEPSVAVAGKSLQGVYLSTAGGGSGTFAKIGLSGKDVRVLEVQEDGSRRFLWAGKSVMGTDPDQGCHRRELGTGEQGWTAFTDGWVVADNAAANISDKSAGSCFALAFHPEGVFAATFRGGVLWLPPARAGGVQRWQPPIKESLLPPRSDGSGLASISAVAALPDQPLLLAGGPRGLYRRDDAGRYVPAAQRESDDQITLPATWIFSSGTHELLVTDNDATEAH